MLRSLERDLIDVLETKDRDGQAAACFKLRRVISRVREIRAVLCPGDEQSNEESQDQHFSKH